MNDKELADRIVALGVGVKDPFRSYMYSVSRLAGVRYDAESFVRDWRVAGALMEKVIVVETHDLDNEWYAKAEPRGGVYVIACHESLPRAIIKACVGALEVESDE